MLKNKQVVSEMLRFVFVGLVATAMALCSDANLNEENQAEGEPTEAALVAFALSLDLNKNDLKI